MEGELAKGAVVVAIIAAGVVEGVAAFIRAKADDVAGALAAGGLLLLAVAAFLGNL